MQKLAIVGSGISALGAAYYLRDQYDITIFEAGSYVGGHTNTVTVDDDGAPLPVDTGFIVYNETTYPNLTRLFADLGVATHESDMSFGMHNLSTGLQYSGQNYGTLFAQRKNIFSPRHWRFLLQASRFNETAPAHLEAGEADIPLGAYLEEQGYDQYFIYNFIVPMGSAVWSTPIDKMLDFTAAALIRFFRNHGFLGMHTQLQWRTVTGGSRSYVQKIMSATDHEVRLNEAVRKIRRESDGVSVHTDGATFRFDKVLIATHADQALAMLDKPTALESELLPAFRYEKNRAVLHTDRSVLPPLKRVWSSWNYKSREDAENGRVESSTVYWMNRLQNLPTQNDYFVSINDFEAIDPAATLRAIDYEHPLFDSNAIRLQARLPELNRNGPIFFAGSYFRYGFHEDGLISGLSVVEKLSRESFQLLAV
ncbi:MAG: FAD-dependent oxidoreductase [Leptospirales bacterium]|jgi:predicted NAD/FAD-binding protein